MKKIKNKCIAIVAVMILVACTKKEEVLTSSDRSELEASYSLEGTNSYNQRIRDYYKRFGSYILYKFTSKDAYWAVTKWDSTYRAIPADSNFIDKQLDLLDTTFFRYYHDSTLKKYLPVKFLLCSSIRINGSGNQVDAYFNDTRTAGHTPGTFIANWGSSRILNMKGVRDSTALFRGNINYGFLALMDSYGKMSRSDKFTGVTDYSTAFVNNTMAQRYKRGFLYTTNTTTPPSNTTDWFNFLAAILRNPYSYLTDATGMNANNTTMQGILTPVKDSSGLIRQKYDQIIEFYRSNYNIDLNRMGNGN